MAELGPVARTAFYCCTLRALDAASPRPLCGDHLADRFLDEAIRAEMEPILRYDGPRVGNVARHRLIDDLLREAIARDPGRRIILLGAGFDTRPFRLAGGRWWEIEDPALLAFKEARLPAGEAPNPLTRIPYDYARESLAERLRPLAGEDEAVVVLEGVSMYLSSAGLQDLAGTVRAALPRALLISDLMSPRFTRRYSSEVRQALGRLGARFADHGAHPRYAIEAAGYRPRPHHSILGRAREAGSLRIPGWLFHTLLRELRDGYAVWQFDPAEG